MRTAKWAREWLEQTADHADHLIAGITMGEARRWAKRVVALDQMDAIAARHIERQDGVKEER